MSNTPAFDNKHYIHLIAPGLASGPSTVARELWPCLCCICSMIVAESSRIYYIETNINFVIKSPFCNNSTHPSIRVKVGNEDNRSVKDKFQYQPPTGGKPVGEVDEVDLDAWFARSNATTTTTTHTTVSDLTSAGRGLGTASRPGATEAPATRRLTSELLGDYFPSCSHLMATPAKRGQKCQRIQHKGQLSRCEDRAQVLRRYSVPSDVRGERTNCPHGRFEPHKVTPNTMKPRERRYHPNNPPPVIRSQKLLSKNNATAAPAERRARQLKCTRSLAVARTRVPGITKGYFPT
ncbi:hypothetical protein K449DRAFT_436838 [Hypoxylon sp. EC38]|nr:hypothetical protein K449DRAFT_436838 [Hypoxylon sp. EC38]